MRDNAYLASGIERLMAKFQECEYGVVPRSVPVNIKTASWRLAIDVIAKNDHLESHLNAVERLSSKGQDKPVQFIPIQFIVANKLTKSDKLLLTFDSLVLQEMIRQEIPHGKIIHGNGYTAFKVKTPVLTGEVRKITGKIIKMLMDESPPGLVLNRHCSECKYEGRCRQRAIEKDDLSLLAGMAEKERKKLNSKGIFTVTQLSYTFRPRRRSKRQRDKREKYHHSLKALAIREKKIHIVGNPELKMEGTPVYLDVEGLPDRDFYYLIGFRIRNGESVIQHSLWANSPEEEGTIWREFIGILRTIDDQILMHYGSFERVFLKQMFKRYGAVIEERKLDKLITESVNILAIIYSQIYFPGFSNGLKEVASFLGFNWTDTDCSGLLSIAWRNLWENTQDSSIKEKLIRYNTQDCEALGLLTETIRQIENANNIGSKDQNVDPCIVRADYAKFPNKSKWHNFTSPVSSLEYVNAAAHWNYQRDRVYARLAKSKPKHQKKPRKKVVRVDMTIIWKSTRILSGLQSKILPQRSRALTNPL